jgi:WD40 repeat protein
MEFSADGQYLATGGQDAVIMVWRVQNQPQTMNYSNSDLAQVASWLRAATTAGSSALQGFLVPSRVSADTNVAIPDDGPHRLYARQLLQVEEPHRVFQGHGGDVLCVAWSANNFLLTSSMDKTVRLWHVDYGQVLRKFLHADFVTCVAFHPRNENFFLSGSLDERIRLWNISSRHVSDYAEVRGLVTACGFTPNGEQALVGTYRGECKVYNVVRFEEGERALQYITTLEVHSRRGRNRKGSKITSFAMMPAAERVPSNRTEPTTSRSPVSSGDQTTSTLSNRQQADAKSTAQQFEVLISTNDSRIRLYRVQDLRIVSKYVGHSCTWNHIRAGFSDDFCYVITASEDRLVYIWDTVLYEHTERSAGDHSWPRHRSLFGRLFGSTGVSNAAASTPSAATTGSATVSVPDLNWRTSQTSDRSPSAPAGTAFDTRMSPSAEVQQPNLATSRSQANPYAAASSISAVPSIRRYRNERFEAFMPFTQAHVTAAIFAPQRSTQRFPVTGSSTQSMLQQPQPPAPLGSAATAPLRPPGARERFRPVARAPGFGRVVVVAAHDGTIGIFESIPADLVPW